MAETAEKPAGLTAAEQKKLDELLAKAAPLNLHGPALRAGKPYVALINLSLPRRGDKDKQCDLVPAGETVYLTDEEAATFLRHGSRDGRRVAVIRPKGEVDANNPPKPPPSLLTGPILRPQQPPPGSDLPRPDPAGSSHLLQYGTGNPVPESAQPQPGTENVMPGPDAVDIPPSGQHAREVITQGADQDLMAAVKAQTGVGQRTNRR